MVVMNSLYYSFFQQVLQRKCHVMERIGIFKELGYISIGDKYTLFIAFKYRTFAANIGLNKGPFNDSTYKNKQMLSGGVKSKSALPAEYFETQFKRIFERERRSQTLRTKLHLIKDISLGRDVKWEAIMGHLKGPIQAISALQNPRKPNKSPGKNSYTSPPKKGSGYSYPDITLSKMVSHSSDPYDRAKEMLKTGGMKAGTFGCYPTYFAEPHGTKKTNSAMTNKEVKIFHLSPGLKSTPVKIIISLNIKKAVSSTNYNRIPSVMAY
ncbi:UPF0602 protein C4orf47 homolog [Carassius gibelio]|uniref:UPF0602 protein C4orf47 homolog n=1 Tax=Carassius gibelio TaxID=101364 RepID=UPI0022782DC2|nr:UPF0602 protein C4orf47 homolog [Carassius gibelio]